VQAAWVTFSASFCVRMKEPQYVLKIEGPEIALGDRAANGLALVFHELATNAAKYCSLNTDEGTVKVEWKDRDREIIITLRERLGPEIEAEQTRLWRRIIGNHHRRATWRRTFLPLAARGSFGRYLGPDRQIQHLARRPPSTAPTPSDLDKTELIEPTKPWLLGLLGPGLVTGASDDDPSVIATYSRVGVQFGYATSYSASHLSVDGRNSDRQARA
jgi:hypothetical protein